MSRDELKTGTKVLVDAVVTSCGNTICGIALHGYENKKRLVEVIKEHVHPFSGVQEWRPIETAPKDGTVVIAWFGSSQSPYAESVSCQNGEWFYSHDGDKPSLHPSHWLPLPPPPSSAEQGEGGGR